MFAPPVAAASSDIHPPCLSAFEQPTEKTLVPESTLSQLVFPNEFPYEFDFTSPEDLTETEDETNEDEDDFLAGLTRRLALFTQRSLVVTDKAKLNSTESTRSGLGSCTTSGNKSPNGPFSQAPSQQASFKVDAKSNRRPNPKPNSFTPFPQNAAFCNYYYWWLRQPQFALVAYPYPVIGVLATPTAVSTGTGVFLPQDYSNPSASRRKRGGGCVKLPTKVVQTQHSKTEQLPGRRQSRSQGRLSAERGKLGRGGTNKSAVTGDSFKV